MAEQEPDDDGPADVGSTLVHRGKSALTFNEMASFVHDIEVRPLPRLLSDLPGLMMLPDMKYQLVVMVLRKKVKEGSAEREPILARVRDLAAGVDDSTVRRRAEAFLAKPQE